MIWAIKKLIKLIMDKWDKRQDELAAPYVEKARAGGIWAVYRLFNRYYIKSFFGPFFTFVFPILIYAILGTLMNSKLLFAGIVAMSGMSAGITGMPFSILELKKSVLLKRIGASPVKPSKFTIVIITYFTFMIFLSILWLMIWALILFRDTSMFNPLGTVTGFFGFFYGNVLNIIMSLSLGFAIATVAKSEVSAQAIGMLIYFPSTFLSGQFISIDVIARSEIMEWISRFIPFRYTTMITVEAWTGNLPNELALAAGLSSNTIKGNPFMIHSYATINNKFDVDYNALMLAQVSGDKQKISDVLMKSYNDHQWATIIYNKADHIVAYIYPYIMIALTSLFSIKKFSWSASR